MNNRKMRFYGKKASKFFPSIKMGKTMRGDSEFEICAMLDFEFDDNVISWQAQPQSYIYEIGQNKHRYTPDVIKKNKDGTFDFIEIKPKVFTKDEAFIEKHGYLNDFFLMRYNRPLKIMTEDDFYHDIKLKNYKALYRYRNYDFSRYKLEKAVEHMQGAKVVGDIYESVSKFNVTKAFAPALFATKKVLVDLTKPFDFDSKVEGIAYV